MLLINGRVMDHLTEDVLDEVRESIYRTVAQPWLDTECVIHTVETLLQKIANGELEERLEQFQSGASTLQGELEQITSILEGNRIRMKYDLELGHWKEEIERDGHRLVVPLGVLLHIAAGNMDVLPIYTVLEGLLSGNINLLKLPNVDQGLTLCLAQELIAMEPRLSKYIYIFDTPSSDYQTIEKLMDLANGIVIWGGEEPVRLLREKANVNVKLIEWGHKLSFCYLAELPVPESVLRQLAKHILTTNQLLCSSFQVIYLNTEDYEVVKHFGETFARILKEMEDEYPIEKAIQGKMTIELVTRELEQMLSKEHAEMVIRNHRTSVCCRKDSKLELSMLYGNILVKPLPKAKIIEELYANRGYLQTVGVYPKEESTIKPFLHLGVTRIKGIEESSILEAEGAHDGMFALQQYCRIVEK